MTFIAFAWIASILFGLVVIVSKLLSKHSIKNPWAFAFIWSLTSLILTAFFALSHPIGLPTSWGSLLIVGISGAGVWIFFTFALYQVDASIIAPLYNLRTVFNAILGVFILSEILSPRQYTLMFFIVIAGIFVTFDEKLHLKSLFKKSLIILLLGIACSSLANIYTKVAINENGYWNTTLWSAILMQFFLLFTFPLFKKDIKTISIKPIGAIILLALIEVVATLMQNKAFETNVSLSTTIVSLPLSMVMAFLFSLFAPKLLEHHPPYVYIVRLIAASVMIFAALQLSI